MKDTTYRCDTCGRGVDIDDIYGYFCGNVGLEFRPAARTAAHICRRCINDIASFAKQPDPRPPIPLPPSDKA